MTAAGAATPHPLLRDRVRPPATTQARIRDVRLYEEEIRRARYFRGAGLTFAVVAPGAGAVSAWVSA
jgi:hypothetical protein